MTRIRWSEIHKLIKSQKHILPHSTMFGWQAAWPILRSSPFCFCWLIFNNHLCRILLNDNTHVVGVSLWRPEGWPKKRAVWVAGARRSKIPGSKKSTGGGETDISWPGVFKGVVGFFLGVFVKRDGLLWGLQQKLVSLGTTIFKWIGEMTPALSYYVERDRKGTNILTKKRQQTNFWRRLGVKVRFVHKETYFLSWASPCENMCSG